MHWPSVLAYMASSFLIIMFNKIILSIFVFQSVPFLMVCQSIFAICVFVLRRDTIQRPGLPLVRVCLLNVGNVFFGISAAGVLNVAMFSALRRVSILMTLLGQWFILHQKPARPVILSVLVMILGAVIASADDIGFDALGYAYVMMNNVLTTGAQIETKRAMDNKWTKTSILFWSAVLSVFVFGIQLINFDPASFDYWENGGFRVAFLFSMGLGFIINWSASWTIEKNDALTLAVAGSTKSAIMGIVVCVGLFDHTYIFTWVNFMGLQLSAMASLCYVYAVHIERTERTERTETVETAEKTDGIDKV